MKTTLKAHFIDTETFLKRFMKTYSISFDQYQADIDKFERSAADLLGTCKDKLPCGIDIQPYIYVLDKVRRTRPIDLSGFLRYLMVMYKRHVDEDCHASHDVGGIVGYFSEGYMVLYLIAAMQYYFL